MINNSYIFINYSDFLVVFVKQEDLMTILQHRQFLQISKILCSYSILFPPKYENCMTEKEVKPPLISLTEIKSLYQKSKENRELLINTIKSKLNKAIRIDDWNIYDIFESKHDYPMPATLDCIIYYITGRVCHQLLQFTKCFSCRQALITNSVVHDRKAKLGDMLLESFVHPNVGFYNFIKNLEHIYETLPSIERSRCYFVRYY